MEYCYPDELLRGIANNSFIDSEGRASALLFQSESSVRYDGLHEISINWYDDENAFRLLLNQRKKNDETEYQFKTGVAILSRYRLDSLINSPNTKDALSYERNIIEGNPFHGNILIKSNIDKHVKRMFEGCLAMCVENIQYR